MSAELRRARFSCRATKRPPRVPGHLGLAGKPTTFSYRETSIGNSFAPLSFTGLRRFRHPGSLFSHGPNVRCVAPVHNLAWTKSKVLKLRKSTADPALASLFLKFLDMEEFGRAVDDTGVDKNRSAEYRCLRKGWSHWRDSASPGPRDSYRSGEGSPVLTPFREGRSRNYSHVRCGRETDHMGRGVLASHEAGTCSVRKWAAHPWPCWALESKPRVPYCPRNPFLFRVAFHRISCSHPQSASPTLGLVPFRCREILGANPREREAA